MNSLPSPILDENPIVSLKSNDVDNLICEVDDVNLSFKISHFYNEKHEKMFINSVKRMVRSSLEYKEWKKFLTETKNLTSCLFTDERDSECTIEFHHHPISLQNIVISIIDKYVTHNKKFSSYDIATQVIIEHFNMNIGIVPLVTTLHEKFHNGFLNIPISFVIGDYNKFIEKYPLRTEMIELIRKYESIKNTNHKGWHK